MKGRKEKPCSGLNTHTQIPSSLCYIMVPLDMELTNVTFAIFIWMMVTADVEHAAPMLTAGMIALSRLVQFVHGRRKLNVIPNGNTYLNISVLVCLLLRTVKLLLIS